MTLAHRNSAANEVAFGGLMLAVDCIQMVMQPVALLALRERLATLDPRVPRLTDDEFDLLRSQVWAAADEFKAAGITPERMVSAIQLMAEDDGIAFAGSLLLELVRAWCLERYYSSE